MTDPFSPDQVHGADLGPSNQIVTKTFIRSIGDKILLLQLRWRDGQDVNLGLLRTISAIHGDILPDSEAKTKESRAKRQSDNFRITSEALDPALPDAPLYFSVT